MHACIPPRATEEGRKEDYSGIKSCLKAFHSWAEKELMQGIFQTSLANDGKACKLLHRELHSSPNIWKA